MKNSIFIFATILAPLIISGCASNPYMQFYKGQNDARMLPGYEPLKGELQIYGTDNFDRDIQDLVRRGYQPIGESSFNTGGNASEYELKEQAARIGAHIALTSSQYTHTVSGAVPLSVPQVQTSYSNASATAYGSGGGMVSAYGTGTTTTYGTQTTMIPYSADRHDVSTLYFAKFYTRVGIEPEALDDVARKRLQTNSGIRAKIVIEGSPAFKADVLPGDVVLKLEGEAVESLENYYQLIDKYEGQTVVLKIDRDGKTLEKKFAIRQLPKQTLPDTPK